LGGRTRATVRFSVAGVTSLRCDFAMCLPHPVSMTVRIMLLLHTVGERKLTPLMSQFDSPFDLSDERNEAD
jgi:hypothetical protein